MHFIRLWKGKRFSNKTTNSFSKRVVPAFNVVCFTGFFANHSVFPIVNYSSICLPEITKTLTSTVFGRHERPKFSTWFFAPISDEISDNLTGSAAKRYPNPSFEGFWINKRPQFVQFEHVCFFCGNKRFYDFGERLGFFFIQLSAVWWLIPKPLDKPREEERSWPSRTTVSLNSSLLRNVWKTPPKPQDLHLYFGFPEPFEPFFTISSEQHLWQHFFSITITKNFVANINTSLKYLHYLFLKWNPLVVNEGQRWFF